MKAELRSNITRRMLKHTLQRLCNALADSPWRLCSPEGGLTNDDYYYCLDAAIQLKLAEIDEE